MKKQIILLIALMLLGDVAYAQESENFPSNEDYKNGDFYKSSDPAGWDWNKVDFSNPAVYQNPKLYFSPEFSANFHNVPPVLYGMIKFYQLDFNQLPYSSLQDQFYQHPAFAFNLKRVPASKYSKVKWDKVDFTKIRFVDVDWNTQLPPSFHQTLAKSKNGLNKYCHEQGGQQCSIQVEMTDISGVVFTGKGMKTEQYGVELKHYPVGALFEVKDGRIIVHLPQNKDVHSQMFASDTVRLFAVQQTRFIIRGEKEVKIVQGELEYKNGEWFIPAGKSAVINNVEITAAQQARIYGLGGSDDAYFRQMEVDIKNPKMVSDLYAEVRENAVYLGERNILAFGARCEDCPVTAETVTLTFKQNNPYLTIKPGGDPPYQQSHEDKLSITPIHGGAVWNNAAGEMTVAGRVRMQNGVHEIVFDNGGVYAKAVLEDKKVMFDSVPMKVRFFDDTMNNPYLDANNQQLKDKNGKPIDNTIQIHDDNYIEFGSVEYFALAVDPYHLLKDTNSGFKLVNNIARFTKPLIIVETPVREKWEQAYFDAAAKILADNVKGIPIVVRLENPKTEGEKQAFLESHSNFFKAVDEEAKKSKVAKFGQPSSEQVIIGHNEIIVESELAYVTPIMGTIQPFVCRDKLIGCTLGNIKAEEIKTEVLDMGLRGYMWNGEFQLPTLKFGSEMREGEIVGGNVYFKDGKPIFNPEGYKEYDKLMTKRVKQPDVDALYDGGYSYKLHRITLGIYPNKAPLHTAIRAAMLNNPELEKKTAKEILLSPDMQRIKFSSCKFAKEASEFASVAAGQPVFYTAEDCNN